jgi:peptidoglycan/xylan/chitin deacetylase (PgdA/CDA1 family)
MEWLKENSYTVLSLSEVVERMKNNRPLPSKLATLSFDDGLRDGYERAYPILRQYEFPATFFITTCILQDRMPPVIALQVLIRELGAERLEFEILPRVLRGMPYATLLDPKRYDIADAKKPEPPETRRIKWVFNHFLPSSLKVDLVREIFGDYLGKDAEKRFCREFFMTSEEIRDMVDGGMDFGSHTVWHPPFDICGLGDVELEARESRQQLMAVVGKLVTVFGWPFGGCYKDRIKAVVAEYYDGAWNFGQGDESDIYNLSRMDQGGLVI